MGGVARHRGTQRARTPPAARPRGRLCPHCGRVPPGVRLVVDVDTGRAHTTADRNAHWSRINEPGPRARHANASVNACNLFCDAHTNTLTDR